MKYLESRKSKVSLAVKPEDVSRSDNNIEGECELKIIGRVEKPLKHHSGYYLFMDLPYKKKYKVEIRGEEYKNAKKSFTMSKTDSGLKVPAAKVTLKKRKK